MEDLAAAFNDMTGRLQRDVQRPGPAGQRAQPAAGPLRAAGRRRLPGRRRRPRDQQSAGQHRLLQRGPGSAGWPSCFASRGSRRRRAGQRDHQQVPEDDPGGGVPLQGDHAEAAGVQPRRRAHAASRPTWPSWCRAVLDMVAAPAELARASSIVFEPRRPARRCAWVNAQEIKSVVLNLVVNALDSMDEGGTLTITPGAARRHGRAASSPTPAAA